MILEVLEQKNGFKPNIKEWNMLKKQIKEKNVKANAHLKNQRLKSDF